MSKTQLQKNLEMYERVARVEQSILNVQDNLREIKDNHLTHLQKAIDMNTVRINWIFILLITTLVTLVLDLFKKSF